MNPLDISVSKARRRDQGIGAESSGAGKNTDFMSVTELSIQIDREKIAAFCKKWHIAKLEIFGSVLRNDFTPDSDLDFLYTAGTGFRPDLAYGPWARNRMADELSALLGRKVDLIERSQIERHRNWIRREHILRNAQPLYVEG